MPGFQELIVIAVVAFLVFGPERLPEAARTAGRLVGRVRNEARRNISEFQGFSEVQQLRDELRGLRRDLDDAGMDLKRGIDSGADGSSSGRRASSSRPARSPSLRQGPVTSVRGDDDPPPTDDEAT